MPFAFVKLHQVPGNRAALRTTLKLTRVTGGGWARFGSNIKGWDIAYSPDFGGFAIAEGDAHILSDVSQLNMTIAEIPTVKRQELNTWLTDNGYDTSWIVPTNTIKEIIMDILDHLNDRVEYTYELLDWVQNHVGQVNLDKTVSQIPPARRDQIEGWLINHNYDTGWITGSTTVRQVLKYMSYGALPGETVKSKLIRWAQQYIGD